MALHTRVSASFQRTFREIMLLQVRGRGICHFPRRRLPKSGRPGPSTQNAAASSLPRNLGTIRTSLGSWM